MINIIIIRYPIQDSGEFMQHTIPTLSRSMHMLTNHLLPIRAPSFVLLKILMVLKYLYFYKFL